MADPDKSNGADDAAEGAVDQDALADEWAALAGLDDDDEDAPREGGPEAGETQPDASTLAHDWAAEMSAEEDAADPEDDPAEEEEGGGGRVLNQDEIDSLLGVSEGGEGGQTTGVMALINTNAISYERLPMLEVVFDRLARIMTTSLRNFTSENVEVGMDNISSQRFGDYLNSVPLPAMIAVFRAVEWDNLGLITIDSPMIYSIVDVLLGGRRGTAPMRVEGRPYTTIEGTLVQRLTEVVLADLGTAFAPISKVEFRFERLETNPRFAAIARPGNAAVVFRLRVDMEDRGGTIEFLLPYATLEPVRDLLLQMFMGEKFGRDSIWENHLAREIWTTDVELEAVLDEQTVTLGQVMSLREGCVLTLNARPDCEVSLRSGGVPLLAGRLGRTGDHIAVRVDRRLERRSHEEEKEDA
jgi:flagellar motor switch protein FliM